MVDVVNSYLDKINFNNVVFIGAYVLFIIGVLFISADAFRFVVKQIRNTIRGQYVVNKSKFYRHIERLILVTAKKNNIRNKTEIFLLSSLGIFVFFFLMLHLQGNNLITSVMLSTLLAAFPYAILRVKLHSMQLKGSYEGEEFLIELINQYKMNYFNIQETIDRTIDYLGKCPNSKRSLFKLSMQLKSCVVEQDYREALDVFVYSIGTEWAKMLSNNLLLAFTSGANVLLGLNDIMRECATVRENIERGKQENTEAFYMTRFLAPILYLGMFLFAVKYRDFTIPRFLESQFFTANGLKFFIGICITGFLNYFLAMLIRRPKFDI